MGLDTVELVMAVEEEFGIAIPDDGAVTLITLSDIRDFVVQALEATGEVGDREAVWERIKAIMRRDHGIADEHLVPGAALVADLGLD